MATSGPLPHGPDVLDPLFQRMCACGLAPREVQGRILAALKREELVILRHVAAGAWSREPRELTRDEEQEVRAATKKYDLDTASAILFEQSPSPDGIIEPIVPEIWGVTVILAIRDGHLIIEFLAPTFLPESYTFAIATPKAVDELLAAACSAPNTESLLPEPVKPWTESEKEIIKVAKRIYVLESDIPPDTIPARLMHDIDRLYKDEAAAKSKPGKRETPRAPPSWNTCDRFLKKLKALRDRGLWKGLATPPPGD